MLAVLAQFGGDLLSTLLWLILFIVFMFFGPRLMTTQVVMKLEKEVADLEEMAEDSRKYIVKSISKKPDKRLKTSVRNFMEFFAVSPVGTDPYGIMKKIDHIIKNSDQRLRYFVNEIAPGASEEKKRNLRNALGGAITTHQIAKIVRHYLELIKKYKMFQLAMVIQMQIPLIARIAKAAKNATHAFVIGMPIGDGIGPLVTASLMDKKVKRFEKEEFVLTKAKLDGREFWISKAEGPGASTGYPGKFLLKFLKRQKIDRIITIDAGLKLEGEKTGIIAEGVGVAMGGTGVDRYEIEEFAVKKDIPLDAIAIKVSDEEALTPMKEEVIDSVPNAIETLKKYLKRANKKERILVIGVGNTCGIGNDNKAAKQAEIRLRKHNKKIKRKKGREE